MLDRLTPREAFDFTYADLHKNRDLGKLSARQLAEFQEKVQKPRSIMIGYGVLMLVLFVLMLVFITPKVWLIFPCGILAGMGGFGAWFGYEIFIDRRTGEDRVSVAKNIPKKRIQKLRYPLDEFMYRVEVDKFRALLTQDQYNSLDDDTSYDFYYKPTDYYHGDFRIFSVDTTWTPARKYRVMVWKADKFNLRDIYELDLNPELDPKRLHDVLEKTAFHARGYLDEHFDDDTVTEINIKWFLLHLVSVGLFAFGHLDATDDILLSFSRVEKKSTRHMQITLPLMNALQELLPLPRGLFALDKLDKVAIWLHQNGERLEWDEKRGKYVARKE